jgi:ATP-dependent DNA ligase
VSLPLSPPVLPQLARSRAALPEDEGWAYEPKWDGFRAIAFVDGDELYLQSRNGKPLLRYFPEVKFPSARLVLDGEIVIFGEGGRQEFDLLGQRIHPAASRIARLAEETPARFIAFDLLAHDDASLLELPYERRRAELEPFVAELAADGDAPELTPSTRDEAEAAPWLNGGEGVVAKELGAPYRPGERVGMVKIKRVRTIDAVVMGWRPGKEADTVGSLILGLYDDDGELRVVGHSSGFKAAEKRSLVDMLAPYASGDRGSADPSRWRPDHELEWIALRPELVVEITFDHVSSGRIRHGTKVQRWRDDKAPRDCRIEQLDA